jgi:hypothetical protein
MINENVTPGKEDSLMSLTWHLWPQAFALVFELSLHLPHIHAHTSHTLQTWRAANSSPLITPLAFTPTNEAPPSMSIKRVELFGGQGVAVWFSRRA